MIQAMRSPFRAHALGALAALLLPLVACSGDDAGGSAEWRELDRIDHLLPTELPDGWVVNTAILRPGRPRDEWAYRADVFTSQDRASVLAVTASLFVPPDGAGDIGPGAPPGDPEEVEIDELVYVFAYSGATVPNDATARQIAWRSGPVTFTVVRAGTGPADDDLLREVADQLADGDDLDFGHPSAAADAGYSLAATITDTEDVQDYTIVWTHADDAGMSREDASDAREDAPSLSMNVGSPMYLPLLSQEGPLPTSAGDAEVVEEEGSLELTFVRDGQAVSVRGDGITPEEMRAFAASLDDVSFSDWKRQLGDRLLIDEPEDR